MSITDNLLNQFDILFSDSEKGSFIVNNKQKIIAVNRAAGKLLHMRTSSLLGKKLYDLIITSGWENTGEKWHTILNKKEYNCCAGIITGRGEKKFRLILHAHFLPGKHLVHIKPLLAKKSKTALNYKSAPGTYFPFEKKKHNQHLGSRSERQVEGVEKSEKDYISVISHELKTPLAVIMSSAGLVQINSGKWPNEKVAYHQNKIIKSVKFINRVLDDLMLMDQFEHKKFSFNPVPENIPDYCENILEEFRTQFLSAYTFTLQYKGTKTVFRIDAILLQHILNNLISNAVKYSMPDSKIELEVVAGEDILDFRVKDKGIGIKKTDMKKIYEPFFRGENVKTIKGNGLGLGIVKHCIEIHGGSISITSKLNAGTTVNFYIKAESIN